jgi:hypothetical protein
MHVVAADVGARAAEIAAAATAQSDRKTQQG